MNHRQQLLTYPEGSPSPQSQRLPYPPSPLSQRPPYPRSPHRQPSQQSSYPSGRPPFPQPASYRPDSRSHPSHPPSYPTGPHHLSQPSHYVATSRHPQQPSEYPSYEGHPDFSRASYSNHNHNHAASSHNNHPSNNSAMLGYARRASSSIPQSHYPEWPDDPVWVSDPTIPFSPNLKRPGSPTFAFPGPTKRARPQLQDTGNYAHPSGYGGQQPGEQRNWNQNANFDPGSRMVGAAQGYQMPSQDQSPYNAMPSQRTNQTLDQFYGSRKFAGERSQMQAEVQRSQGSGNMAGFRPQNGAVVPRLVPNQQQRGGNTALSMGQTQQYQGIELNNRYGSGAPGPMLQNGNPQQQMRSKQLEQSASGARGNPVQFPTPSTNNGLPVSEINHKYRQGEIPHNVPSGGQIKTAAEQASKKTIMNVNAAAYANASMKNNATSNSVNQAVRPAVKTGPFLIDNDDDDDFIKDVNPRKAIEGPPPTSTGDDVVQSADGQAASAAGAIEQGSNPRETQNGSQYKISNDATQSSDASMSQSQDLSLALIPARPTRSIDFSKGRRGNRPLTYGLGSLSQSGSAGLPSDSSQDTASAPQPAPLPRLTGDQIRALEAEKRKAKAEEQKAKKAAEKTANKKHAKELAALAKIKEKEEMAAKASAPDALFEEPVNEAAKARIEATRRKEEQKKLEAEIKRKHKLALTAELERAKTEAVEKAKAEKEAEKEAKRAKTAEEREAGRAEREEEEKKRLAEHQRKAEELLEQKRLEQEERDIKAREKEAAEELKRQEDAEKIKKALDEAKQAAASLKPAKKKAATEKVTEEASNPKADAKDLFEEQPESLFVDDSMDVDSFPSHIDRLDDKTTAEVPKGISHSQPLMPTSSPQSSAPSKQKKVPFSKSSSQSTTANPSGVTAVSETLSLRARGGWKVARKADVETKAVSSVFQDFMEKFLADQKKQQEAAARERAHEKAQEKKDFAALLEKFGLSVLPTLIQKEVKTAVDKVTRERPVLKEQDPLNPFRGLASAQQKYLTERRFSNGKRPVGRPPNSEKQEERQRIKREKDGLRLAEKARGRFETKLKKDNAEQSRPMSKGQFEEYIERQMKEWWDKREKRQQEKMAIINSQNNGEGSQNKSRFGREDVDSVENTSQAPGQVESNNQKGRAGGIMARMRESNGSTEEFKAAAATKVVWGEKDYMDSDPDSDSEESEEDPDYEEVGHKEKQALQLSQAPRIHKSQAYSSEVSKLQDSHESTSTQDSSLGINSENVIHRSKPRHLQDKDMVYVFSVQRSDRKGNLQSEPVTIKNFLDRDEANAFADDELRKTRWGRRRHITNISQTYSTATGLLSGIATIDADAEEYQHIDVVATAQYTGSLEDYDDQKVRPFFKPTLYIVYLSITKMVPIDDEPTEVEEAEGQPKTEDKSKEPIEVKEAEEKAKTEDKGEEVPANTSTQPDDGDLSALFEEEFEKSLEEGTSTAPAGSGQQTTTRPEVPAAQTRKHMLKETCTPLATYTDRELANKRASEIFLAKVKPVGGDFSLLEEYENICIPQIREHLEEANREKEMFKASNQLENEGEELSVWVDDFELEGPLN